MTTRRAPFPGGFCFIRCPRNFHRAEAWVRGAARPLSEEFSSEGGLVTEPRNQVTKGSERSLRGRGRPWRPGDASSVPLGHAGTAQNPPCRRSGSPDPGVCTMEIPRRDAWPAAAPRLRNRPLRNLITEPRNQACGTNLPAGRGPLRNGPLRNLVTEPRNQESGTKEPGEPGPLRKRESCEVGKAIFEVGNCFAAV